LRQKQKGRRSASLEDWPDGLEEILADARLEAKEGEIDRRVMPVIYCLVAFFTRSFS
jgi:hypothetical protein